MAIHEDIVIVAISSWRLWQLAKFVIAHDCYNYEALEMFASSLIFISQIFNKGVIFHYVHWCFQISRRPIVNIGIDFGCSPGTLAHAPPNNWETPIHLSLFNTFPPIFWFAHPMFLTSLCQWLSMLLDDEFLTFCLVYVHSCITNVYIAQYCPTPAHLKRMV